MRPYILYDKLEFERVNTMTRRIVCLLMCLAMISGFLVLPVSADFQLTYYNEEVYAGGILDMQAFVGESDLSGYTFQWQADAGLGSGSWYDLTDNASYKGTKTNHLQLHTTYGGDYTDWDKIPFRCRVTKNGVTKTTPNLYMEIRPSGDLVANLKYWEFGLYEPHADNAISLTTSDYSVYTARTYAGTKLDVYCGGNTATQKAILTNSEVELRRQIRITENGKYVESTDRTTYIPYTVGNNAVRIEVNMRIIMAGVDRGVYQTKTINLTTQKPPVTGTGTAKTACSVLRYTYNESEKLASVPKGTSLEVTGKEGSYYQVFYNNRVGYIPTSALEVQAAAGEPMIETVDLTIRAPVAGESPATTCTITTPGCELYKTDPITWTDKTTGKIVKSTETFVEGHSYNLSVWVATKSGYKFRTDASGDPWLTGSINGNLPPYIYKAYEQDPEKVIELTYDFNNIKKPAAHTHTPSAWRTTGIYHYKVCTTCGEFLEQEDHKGGTATCTQKALCQVCGVPYGQNEPDHKWSPKYHAVGEQGHAYQCADCKAYDTIHEHIPGPAGTPDAAVVCRDCGYIIQPEKDHKQSLTKVEQVPATCLLPGTREHYTCSGCSDKFSDGEGNTRITDFTTLTVSPLGHTSGDSWKLDTEYHWFVCTTCGTVLEETRFVHEFQEGKCTTCGYKEGNPIDPEKPAEIPDTEEEEEKGLDWPIIAMIGLVCFGLAVTVAVIVIKRKKRISE